MLKVCPANRRFRRYVMEDRWTAIRWAIGTAQKNDCVVIAGKGAEDFQEWDIGFGMVKVSSFYFILCAHLLFSSLP